MYPSTGPIPEGERKQILKDLKQLINYHAMDMFANTPEPILAEFLLDCFVAYAKAIDARRSQEEKQQIQKEFCDICGMRMHPMDEGRCRFEETAEEHRKLSKIFTPGDPSKIEF